MSEFFLYNYRRCPFCIRVRMVFLWKGISFEKNEENLRDRSKGLVDFYSGRKATVPLLLHDGKVVFESLDIMEYLEDGCEDKPLSKKDFRTWGDWSAGEFRDAIQEYKYEEREQGAKKVLR